MSDEYVSFKRKQIVQYHEHPNKWRLKRKLEMADIISTRCHIHGEDKIAVRSIITSIEDFNLLHKKCGYETTIAGICLYVKKTRDSRVALETEKVLQEYGLTEKIAYTIAVHIGNYYQQKVLLGYMK